MLREYVGLELRILDSVDEKAYYNETRDRDGDDDPSKSTRIREWAGQKVVCERLVSTLAKIVSHIRGILLAGTSCRQSWRWREGTDLPVGAVP